MPGWARWPGKMRGSTVLLESSRSAVYLTVLALLVATLSLVASFVNRDFEVAYVAQHSDLAMPHRFTWVAFYAGNEGSLAVHRLCPVESCRASRCGWRRRRSGTPCPTPSGC